jgi:hypothetical protein
VFFFPSAYISLYTHPHILALVAEPLPERERGIKINFEQGRYIKQLYEKLFLSQSNFLLVTTNVCCKCRIEKYDENIEAMTRDIKLNFYQHSAGQLRKLIAE